MAESDAEDVEFIDSWSVVDVQMIWATRTGEDEIRLYLSENETWVLSDVAAKAISRALAAAIDKPLSVPGA